MKDGGYGISQQTASGIRPAADPVMGRFDSIGIDRRTRMALKALSAQHQLFGISL